MSELWIGMRYISLMFIVLLMGCTPAVVPTVAKESDMPSLRYLALGDSYTIGESVAEADRWPNQLAKLIELSPQFAGSWTGVDVTIIAKTGWTTSELWQGVQEREIHPPYDLVSLLIGVNNQYRGYDTDQYREEFRFLLNKAIEYAGGKAKHVIVLSIPDWGVTPFADGRDAAQIAKDIDVFNAINQEESEKAEVHCVDITPVSREAVSDPTLIAGDGLHPSGKMYTAWAKLALTEALKALQ